MTKSELNNLFLTTLLLLISSNTSFGQKIEPKERITEHDHSIASKIMERDYQLYISFPSGYSTKDTISYPVLYVLDGSRSFQIFNPINKRFSSIGKIKDVIVVGIGSGLDAQSWAINRYFDYTISVDTLSERKADKKYGVPKGTVKTGGAGRFLESIKNEIVPYIDKHYKTNNDRGITGHSLGGLFTAFCLINSDGYFTRFGINSPSLYWDDDEFLNQAVTEIENKNDNKIEYSTN
jgi:predicted alpha/beta superfamily hydrolase